MNTRIILMILAITLIVISGCSKQPSDTTKKTTEITAETGLDTNFNDIDDINTSTLDDIEIIVDENTI